MAERPLTRNSPRHPDRVTSPNKQPTDGSFGLASTGLIWLDRIINHRYEWFASHCWFVTHWLGELRETTALVPPRPSSVAPHRGRSRRHWRQTQR
jgi:hypothetical protein